MRNQLIVDVQVVGETVHEHKGGSGARVFACVDSSLFPRNIVFDEGWFGVHVVIRLLIKNLYGRDLDGL
jgi:hypothetical protein